MVWAAFEHGPYHPCSDSQVKLIGIRSLSEFGNPRGPSSKQCSTSNNHHLRLALKLFRREPAIPSSIEFLRYPQFMLTFQRKSVRSSIQCYLNFNLTKGRSPGFGSTTKYSTPYSDSLSLRLHIRCLTLHQIVTRRLQRHAITHKRALTTCKHTVSSSFHFRGTFHLSSRYWFTIGHREYLALGDGPPRFRRNFTCSVVLRIHSRENMFSTTGLLPSLIHLSR